MYPVDTDNSNSNLILTMKNIAIDGTKAFAYFMLDRFKNLLCEVSFGLGGIGRICAIR